MAHNPFHQEENNRRGLFPSIPAPLEQRTNPSQERQRGLSPQNPLEILLGKGDEPSRHGLLGSLMQGAGNVLGAGGEAIAEGFQMSPVSQIASQAGQIVEDNPEFQNAFSEQKPLGAGAQTIGRAFVGDLFPGGGEGEDSAAPPDAAEQEKQDAVNELLRSQDEGFQALESFDELAKNLPPEAQAQAAKVRQQMEQQLAQVQGQITNLTRQGLTQETLYQDLFERQFEGEEFIPGATPEQMRILEEELGRVSAQDPDASFSPEILEVIDAIMESNLSEAEKTERLDFIKSEQEVRAELGTAMSQLVSDRRALEQTLALPDAELLGDEAEFSNIRLNMDLQFDEFGRTMTALLDEVEGVLEQQFSGTIPPQFTNALVGAPDDPEDGILDLVAAGQLEPGSDELRRVVDNMTGGDPTLTNQIVGAIPKGLEAAALRNEAWNTALDQTRYEPGSWGLISAIFQVAQGLGIDPQTSAQLAEDRNMHHIIQLKSSGQVGFEENGQLGIGALTPEAYDRIGMPYEQVKGKPEEELAALILYMMESGNPARRMQNFIQTGVWGN